MRKNVRGMSMMKRQNDRIEKEETNPDSIKPEDYVKLEKWGKILDTAFYLISIVIYVGIFYVCVLVGIVNKNDTNLMGKYSTKKRLWVVQ